MCGIAGIVGFHRAVEPAELTRRLEAMAARLHHRGPDHAAVSVGDGAGFAHTRLSIVDVSEAGNQPFVNDRYVLVYNGEIYNHLALRKQLEAEGVGFVSRSDTEVLFHMLVRRGVERTLAALRGMFAFSFYDRRDRVLYLARDRVGIKPLVFSLRPDGLYFASEVKAFLGHFPLHIEPAWALVSLAMSGEQSGERTMFAGVRQVPPGSYVRYAANGELDTHEYFHVADLVDRDHYRELDRQGLDGIRAGFAATFRAAVSSMLMSDVPMGALVSGGIDSSLMAHLAAEADPTIALFTANVEGPFSELPDAQLLASSIDRPLHVTRFTPDMVLRDLAATTFSYECPVISFPNAIPLGHVCRLAHRHGVKAVLAGEASDELFLGYKDELMKPYLRLLRIPVTLYQRLFRAVPALHKRLFPDCHPMIPQQMFEATHGERIAHRARARERFGFLPDRLASEQAHSAALLLDPLIGVLHRNDRVGMAASIEARFPYLDEAVLRFGINLPIKWKLRYTARLHDPRHPFVIDKFVVRDAAERVLPPRLVRKKKWYFVAYGPERVRIQPGFFRDGYVAELLGLRDRDEASLLASGDRLFLTRLAALDVFGRLFQLGQPIDGVAAHIQRRATMEPGAPGPRHAVLP